MVSPSSSSRGDQTPKARGRVAKRSGNACARCRRQKIKCSGTQPCDACKKRRLACEFDERDQKIMVTKGYILDLQDQIQTQRTAVPAGPPRNDQTNDSLSLDSDETSSSALPPLRRSARRAAGDAHRSDQSRDSDSQPTVNDPVASRLRNPLALGSSAFMRARDGRSFYLGTSSNWSFTRRVLNLAHEFVHQSPVSPDSLLFDGTTYDLPWDGLRNTPTPDSPVLPSLDHAMFLINSVKFHCAQIFHLFDEETFMPELYDFYANPAPQVLGGSLFYIHLLLILAFGKALVNQDNQQKKPPGIDFFAKALQMLPDIHILVKTQAISTEILCCIALYFQCLDHRNSAYNYIGQAMRLVMTTGMHTNMPIDQFGTQYVQRCRKIWLTVYVMDREMTSLMGIPPSVSNEDVYCDLPTFSGSVQRQSALRMQIKVSHSIARITREVYGADGRLNKNFLASSKDVLASVADQADELRRTFPLPLDRNGLQGISRISAYLHLMYHQCIVLATRPLLFCFLKIHFESPETYLETLNSSATVANLMKLCVESSQQMIGILICLQDQGLLEKFLPHDLESLFVSTVNLILGPSLDPSLSDNSRTWVDKAYELFGEFTRSGNLIAQLRRSELQQLDDMLSGLPWRAMPSTVQQPTNMEQLPQQPQQNRGEEFAGMDVDTVMPHPEGDDNPFPTPLTGNFDEFGWDSGLTTAQMMDLANSIGSSDTEWMQHAMTEHSIW